MDSSVCYNDSKIESNFPKHDLFRMRNPPHSPDMSLCDFWLFGVSKGILKDREFTSSDEIEDPTTIVWNALASDDVQSAFRNWMSRLSWVVEYGGQYVHQ
jgi:hypothetical protein